MKRAGRRMADSSAMEPCHSLIQGKERASEEMAPHPGLPVTMKICAVLGLRTGIRDRRVANMRLLTNIQQSVSVRQMTVTYLNAHYGSKNLWREKPRLQF